MIVYFQVTEFWKVWEAPSLLWVGVSGNDSMTLSLYQATLSKTSSGKWKQRKCWPPLGWLLFKTKQNKKQNRKSQALVRMWRNWKSWAPWVGIETGVASVGNSMAVSQNANIELLYDPTISLIGIDPKELKTGPWTEICSPVFTAALSIAAQRWEEPKCP